MNSRLPLVLLTVGALGDSFPSFAVRELAPFKGGVTVTEWLRAHPKDTLATFPTRTDGDATEDWCARASLEQHLPDSSRAVRHAYFYVPPLTLRSTLPAAATPDTIARQCVLGAMWVETGVPTGLEAGRLAAA